MTYDNSVAPHRYVRLNLNTDNLLEDDFLTPEEAANINAKLAAEGSIFKWIPFCEEPEDERLSA